MNSNEFTSYREVATITRDLFVLAIQTETITPVNDYLKSHGIEDATKEAIKVCKIARATGMPVVMRNGHWYERGVLLF